MALSAEQARHTENVFRIALRVGLIPILTSTILTYFSRVEIFEKIFRVWDSLHESGMEGALRIFFKSGSKKNLNQ